MRRTKQRHRREGDSLKFEISSVIYKSQAASHKYRRRWFNESEHSESVWNVHWYVFCSDAEWTFVEAKEILSLLIHECKFVFSFMFTPVKRICKSMYLKLSTFVLLCFVLNPKITTMQHIQFPAWLDTSGSKMATTFIRFHTNYNYRADYWLIKEFMHNSMLWPQNTFTIVHYL